ncbi:MAG TPA: DegT/DnrJ/EryC1/StrS family aminotransferase [Candidatus Eisenbacteria bacterium]|nr:DegT/DnrJ/EryC1/StrS family aminotransferase [Candidatus Eisenbacteria bacterium]
MNGPVPFFDLSAQNKTLKAELNAAWKRTVDSREFILGKDLKAFEEAFADFCGVKHAVGVSSGLDALTLSLKAIGVGPGDEVVVPANTFIATALAVSQTGAKPVLCDVDEEHLLMDVPNARKAITKKTKALIPVHLYGQPCDMEGLLNLAKGMDVKIVEDACQAHGAHQGGRHCGAFGEAGAFSFYPGKNLGAFGDGGLVTTDDDAIHEKLLLHRNYGSVVKYRHVVQGHNMRLDTLQAAILSVKLKRLPAWNKRRNAIAHRYAHELKGVPGIVLPKDREGSFSAYHLYILRSARRDELKAFLEKNGVGTGIHYPVPIHLQEAYKALGHKKGDFPVSEKSSDEVLSLPMYPELPLHDADRVASLVREFFKA